MQIAGGNGAYNFLDDGLQQGVLDVLLLPAGVLQSLDLGAELDHSGGGAGVDGPAGARVVESCDAAATNRNGKFASLAGHSSGTATRIGGVWTAREL